MPLPFISRGYASLIRTRRNLFNGPCPPATMIISHLLISLLFAPLTRCAFITRPGSHRTTACLQGRCSFRELLRFLRIAARIFIRFQGTFSRVMSPLQIVIITVAIALLFVPLTRCFSCRSGFHRTISCSDSGAFLKRILRHHKLQ